MPQNDHNFISRFSIYSYKYFRERSWYANGGHFPGVALGGAALEYASHLLSNSKTWYNLNKMRSYSQKYFGNQYESAAEKARGKKIAAKFSRTLGSLGTAAGIYGGVQTYFDYENGKYTDFGAGYLIGSNVFGMTGGAAGGAWDVGTTVGQWIVESDWYFNLVHNNNYW